jgi:protein-tyrosine phosphatase
MLISDAVQIWRESDGHYHVEWEISHPATQVTVEPLGAPGGVEIRPIAATGLQITGLPAGNRHYFRLRDQHGNEVLAGERRLALQGAPNFRDFGGYRTADGRLVKWGCLYRSGQLSTLTEPDVALLATLELDLVCDFRRIEEQRSEPSRLPGVQPLRVASLPIVPGSNARYLDEAHHHLDDPRAMFDFMLEINRDFAERQSETFSCMFSEILAIENARILVHCAAGKDRTGFAAAIILLALGVPRDAVLRDYLLTGRFFRPEREMARLRRKYALERMSAETILPMLETRADYLVHALAAIEQSHRSLEHYLEAALGVGPAELAELRARYLL